MSDMKVNEDPISYTVRDLNRRTAEVLAAAAKFGSVTIRARSGERFLLKAEGDYPGVIPRLPDFAARRQLLELKGYVAPPPDAGEWANAIITGDL